MGIIKFSKSYLRVLHTTILLGVLLITLFHPSVVKGEESPLVLGTDKNEYSVGETVTFYVTNIGNETLTFVGFPFYRVYT